MNYHKLYTNYTRMNHELIHGKLMTICVQDKIFYVTVYKSIIFIYLSSKKNMNYHKLYTNFTRMIHELIHGKLMTIRVQDIIFM